MKLAISKKNIWEKLPYPLKKAAGIVTGFIPPQYLIGKRFRRQIEFLNEAQWWSAEQNREYQLSELRRILTIAYDKTAYYRRSFSEVGFDPRQLKSLEDIRILPTIDRGVITDHLDEMCTTPTGSSHVDYITTGGTSGKPLRFYIGAARSEIEYAYLLASWQRAGFKLGTPMAVFRGRIVSEERDGLRHEYAPIFRNHYYSNFHMNQESMQRYIEHIRSIGPCYLHVYPSSVANLARFIRSAGIVPPKNILGIIAESENIYPDQRNAVEDLFGCRYFSSYGHTEKLVAAAECEKSAYYHVWPTYGYFELLDSQGQVVATPGQRGEIVGTGFINDVVPFVRYRTGDYATYVGEHCSECGRQHMVIADIRGHNVQENLVANDNSFITWSAVNMHDDTFDRVVQFQFYQDTPGKAVLKVVPAQGFGENDKSIILRNLGCKFDGRLDFTISVTDSISLSTRGKAIFVDQQIPGISGI